MIGEKMYKNAMDMDRYEEWSAYCIANNARIENKSEYYEVVDNTPTLDEAKAAKIALFKSNRDTEEVEDIEYNGNMFDYDDKAQARINVAYQVLQTGAAQSIAWTTADNKNVDMTAADFAGLLGAVAVRSNVLHMKYRDLKAQIEACKTTEEVEAITW